MPLQIDTLEGRPDVARLIEDLSATMPLYRSVAKTMRVVHPSTAMLQLLGEGYLDRSPLELSQTVRRAGGFPALVDSFVMPVCGGSVRLSYFLMAIVLGQPDLRIHYLDRGTFDWDGALRWLVLHGVREMHLWPYLSAGFVRDLRSPRLLADGKRLTPLQAMTMAEQPDVREAFRAEHSAQDSASPFRQFFDDWFMRQGVAGYAHAWMMSADEVVRKMRQDPTGAWTGAAAAAAANDEDNQPDHAAFLDRPTDPPSAASLARATGRANYRMYGSQYPCAFLDISDERAALSAIVSGEARSAPGGGVEFLSPFIEVRLPDTRQPTAMLRLELAVPHALQDRLSVRLRVCDSVGTIGFSRRYSGRAIGAEPVVIPLLLRDLSPRLEVAFAFGGRPPATGRDAAIAFATLRSLQFWQVLADTETASALPAGSA
jgi:hypothetical protein